MLTGKHRSIIAISSALLLTGAGVAVANAVTSPAPPTEPKPIAATVATVDPRAAELERTVADLLAQASGLEAAVAASIVPVMPPAPAPAARAAASGGSGWTAASPSGDDDDDAPAAPPSATYVDGDDYDEDDSDHEDESDEEDEDGGEDD